MAGEAERGATMVTTAERQTLDFPDFCKTIGIGETKGRDLVRRGLVPCIRAGRRIVIPCRVVNEILSGERDLNAPYNEHANDR